MYTALRELVCEANLQLEGRKLVIYSWGNVSGLDRDAGVMLIKPSGVPYDQLTPEKLVALDLDGKVVEGDLKPSSDTPTHLELYRAFESIGGICHTHSLCATMWAQAQLPIPCLGTTHADYFYGSIPVTEPMGQEEIRHDYEHNTGQVIVQRFAELDPLQMPAVLVAGHGPFTWGATAADAVDASVVLEQVAEMAAGTLQLNPHQQAISQELLDKHYLRKHGDSAMHGQQS